MVIDQLLVKNGEEKKKKPIWYIFHLLDIVDNIWNVGNADFVDIVKKSHW